MSRTLFRTIAIFIVVAMMMSVAGVVSTAEGVAQLSDDTLSTEDISRVTSINEEAIAPPLKLTAEYDEIGHAVLYLDLETSCLEKIPKSLFATILVSDSKEALFLGNVDSKTGYITNEISLETEYDIYLGYTIGDTATTFDGSLIIREDGNSLTSKYSLTEILYSISDILHPRSHADSSVFESALNTPQRSVYTDADINNDGTVNITDAYIIYYDVYMSTAPYNYPDYGQLFYTQPVAVDIYGNAIFAYMCDLNGDLYANLVDVKEAQIIASYYAEDQDSYEPNNVMLTATAINNNVTISNANINVTEDVDFYKFTLSTTSMVAITLTNVPAGCDYDIALFNSSGSMLAYSARIETGMSGNEQITKKLTTGTYYIRVNSYSGASSSSYSLQQSTSTTAAPPNTLPFWFDSVMIIGGYYPSRNLTYGQNKLNNNTNFSFEAGNQYATTTWSSALDLNITLTNTFSTANIRIYGGTYSELICAGWSNLQGNEAGLTRYGTRTTAATINRGGSTNYSIDVFSLSDGNSVAIVDNNSSKINYTTTHEVGHALGFRGHSYVYYPGIMDSYMPANPPTYPVPNANEVSHIKQFYARIP